MLWLALIVAVHFLPLLVDRLARDILAVERRDKEREALDVARRIVWREVGNLPGAFFAQLGDPKSDSFSFVISIDHAVWSKQPEAWGE